MKKIFIILTVVFGFGFISSCNQQFVDQNESLPSASVKTTHIQRGKIESQLSFNGKTIYLKKNEVVSPIAGYVVTVNTNFGAHVKKDDVLFEIQTKESRALQNSSSNNPNMGTIRVVASSSGIVSELIISETGGYLSEGSLLCNLIDLKDIKVQVNIPFKYNTMLKTGTHCTLYLSDNTSLSGVISQVLPNINESNQTQVVLITPQTSRQLPENLNLMAQFTESIHSNILLVPKTAVMANETQSEFWIMKLTKGNMAVRIPITKGLENDSLVEIRSPILKENELIIREGAYGLPDSTLVSIIN